MSMQSSLPAPPFRNDINGLRAYAVIAVLLFHFQIPGFSAGFLGVDIFFVISGFLMTSIIVRGLEKNNFSIFKFYMARVRRIVPVLMFLIAVLLILGWFWLPTPDFKALGSQSASALAFISNIYFWRSSGYFDAAAHDKWLLHTWTLGAEFQFYILFPIFLIILWKLKPSSKTLLFGVIFAFVASLALSVVASSWKPVAAFYLLPTRGWEFLAGGLVFFIGRDVQSVKKYSKVFLILGFTLWLIAMVMINSSFSWPSGWALLPVMGTALIMLANQKNSVLTAHPIAQWLGDRSYSIYLWHWPIVVALYFAGIQAEWLWIIAGLFLSLMLGDLSYRLVETPTRTYFSQSSLFKQVIVIGALGLIVGVSAVSARLFTFEGRLSAEIEVAAAEATNREPRRTECFGLAGSHGSPGCIYGKDNISAILMGDSHAEAIVTSTGTAAKKYNRGVVFWGMTSCPTLDNIKYTSRVNRPTNICNDLNTWADNEMTNHLKIPLILISRTSSYIMGPNEPGREEEVKTTSVYFSKAYATRNKTYQEEFQQVLTSTACRLAKDRSVYLMRPVPEMGIDVPKTLSRNMLLGRGDSDIKITLDEYHKRNKLVWQAQDAAAQQCGVKILNPLPYLCDEQYCYGSKNGRPLYYDDDHMSEYGNKFLVPMFEQVFTDQKLVSKQP